MSDGPNGTHIAHTTQACGHNHHTTTAVVRTFANVEESKYSCMDKSICPCARAALCFQRLRARYGGKGKGGRGKRERRREREKEEKKGDDRRRKEGAHHQEQARWARDCRASTYKHPFGNQRHYSMDINPICVSLCYNILEQPVQQQPCGLYLGVRVCCLQARCNVIRRAQLSRSSRRPRASASLSRFSVGRGWQSCQTGQLCQRVKDLGEERPSECDAGINRARVSINRREQGAAPRERSWGAPTLLSRSGGERGGRGSEHPISVLECILGC